MKENYKILKELLGKQFSFSELKEKGFKDEQIIKSLKNKSNNLLQEIIYQPKTYYKGVTLVIENEDNFSVIANTLTEKQATNKNKIIQLESELDGLENTIWAYRFEFKNEELASNFEKKARLVTAKIKMLKAKEKLENDK